MGNEEILVNGETLRHLRLKHGFTQKEIAEQLGILPTRYCNWETGRANPPTNIIKQFCEILDEDYNQFKFVKRINYPDCKLMNEDFKDVKSLINSIENNQLRRKLIFEFGDLMEEFKKRIETEVLSGEK